MERSKHQCKLCTRSFSNGRALGGHMKAHLATLPLPPKPAHHYSRSSSFSSFSSEEGDDEEEQEIGISSSKHRGFVVQVLQEKSTYLGYGLRENPKKSCRLADPEFSFAIDSAAPGSVVLDRESETEPKNPTRARSKRSRTAQKHENLGRLLKKAETFVDVDRSPEPVLSSVSDSPEEDVAMCLMMLSKDAWVRKSNNNTIDEDEETGGNDCKRLVVVDDVKVSKIRGGKFKCEKCMKLFRSLRALIGHKRICSLNAAEVRSNSNNGGGDEKERIFECPYCFKVFGSGQALGGHKRSHLLGSFAAAAKSYANLIDLNLPAPVEDDECSVVSDA